MTITTSKPWYSIHHRPKATFEVQGDRKHKNPVIEKINTFMQRDWGIDEFAGGFSNLPPGLTVFTAAAATVPLAVGTISAARDAHEKFTQTYPAARRELRHQVLRYQQVALRDAMREVGGSPRLDYERAKLRALYQVNRIKKLERNASPLQVISSAGLTSGVALSSVGAAVTLAGSMAAPAITTAAGAALAPAQALMGVLSAMDMCVGYRTDKNLCTSREGTSAVSHLLDDGVNRSLKEHHRQQRRNNFLEKGLGGGVTAASQVGMFTGVALSLTGIAAPVGAGVVGASIPLAVAGGYLRTRYGERFVNATGEGASPVTQRAIDRRDTGADIDHHGLEGATRIAAARYRQDSVAVSEGKLLSLISYSMRHERDKGPVARTAEERRAHVGSMVTTGKKSFFKGTTLLKSDIERMQRIFDDPRLYQREFFEGPVEAVEARVRARLSSHPIMQQAADEQNMQNRLATDAANQIFRSGSSQARDLLAPQPGQKKREINDAEWLRLREQSTEINAASTSQFAKTVSREMKATAKRLRAHDAQEIGYIGRAMGAVPQAPVLGRHDDPMPRRSWPTRPAPTIFVRSPSGREMPENS